MFKVTNLLGICGSRGLVPLNAVAFRTLCLVLGEPKSTRSDGASSVLYRWSCGCAATCADGYKCTDLGWCEQHADLLWLPAEGIDSMEAT